MSVLQDARAVIVTDEHDGWRIDRFVAAVAPEVSRTRAQALIAAGRITLDGKSVKVSQVVEEDDVVGLPSDIALPPIALPEAEDIPLAIVYEDEHMLVVDKAAGMVVHPAPGHEHGTLVNALLAHTATLGGSAMQRPGIVHRLDKDTSGLLLVAKDDATQLALGAMMREHTITKEYIALIEGMLDPPHGAVEAPIGRDPRHRLRMAVVTAGRYAKTLYTTERIIAGRSLLRATLITGRTHQIRVHFAAVGHPVVGDVLYGRSHGALPPRQFLHATHLVLPHPITGVLLDLVSPLPHDLATFLDSLPE